VHGFDVSGLEQTEAAFGRAEGDVLYSRLRRLLERFDHVIVQGPSGDVERVIVLGEKVPVEPPSAAPSKPRADEGEDIRVQTQRRGTQHVVRVSLGGKGGSKVERELHVDTGADYLVLPQSLMSQLGVDQGTLEERDMQTANGKVKARIGTLPSLWLGGRQIKDVETAFLEDSKLGSSGLLGMSVLRRYKLTIDDARNSITLGRKEAGGATEAGGAEAGSADPGDKEP
jgi:clan AA aspartic protease (TIGR02281 family)